MADILKVSEVARLLRLSADSIRFYEKRGIIKPKRQGDNQYRLFHMDDIRRLYDCKIFQNLGFTIAEIEGLSTDKAPEEIENMLAERERQLNQDILRSRMALHKIARIRESSRLAARLDGKFLIQPSPRALICFYAESNHFQADSVADPYFQTVMDYHNLFDCAVIIPREQAQAPDVHKKCKFGFSLDQDLLDEWPIPLEKTEEVLESRICVYTAFSSQGIVSAENLSPAFQWMERRNLRLDGDIFCKMRRVTFEEGRDIRNYEVWLPMAEKKGPAADKPRPA